MRPPPPSSKPHKCSKVRCWRVRAHCEVYALLPSPAAPGVASSTRVFFASSAAAGSSVLRCNFIEKIIVGGINLLLGVVNPIKTAGRKHRGHCLSCHVEPHTFFLTRCEMSVAVAVLAAAAASPDPEADAAAMLVAPELAAKALVAWFCNTTNLKLKPRLTIETWPAFIAA